MCDVEPLATYLARIAAAAPEDYRDLLRESAERFGLSNDEARAEFARMKAYILNYYGQVTAVQSFPGSSGQIIDCVPFEQQPSVREALRAGLSLKPPPSPAAKEASLKDESDQAQTESRCPAETVPMPRLTLERLIALGKLENVFRK